MTSFEDERAELRLLVQAASELVAWYDDSGADALLCDADPKQLLGMLDGTQPGQQRGSAPTFKALPPVPAAHPAVAASVRARVAAPAPSGSAASMGPVLDSDERYRRLTVLSETVRGCTKCGLHATRTQTVFSRGDPNSEICFIGEGPGADEDAQGEPFVGKAGQLLDKMIAAMGLRRDEVYIANIVKCRPPNNRTPEPLEMTTCMPYLAEQIDVVRPKAIVTLGNTALKGLLGTTEGITRARGTWKLYRGAIPVMPTYHPAFVLRQPTPEIRGQVWSDLQQVLRHLGRPLPARQTASKPTRS